MFKSNEKFHSANGKRQILIADDESVNREILGLSLEEDYELLYACDGTETLELMRLHCETLSMVLLDLMMPGMNGLALLRIKKEEPAIASIPVIVVTSDHKAEVECLDLGAIDFIPKPYPQGDVIKARVRRIIELNEDRQIIQSTERDELTGLYTREFFYRYAEQFDQYHRDLPMDAIVIDINHFHMINERFGTSYGDTILRRIGEKVRGVVREEGGLACRREADTFMVYCPHGKNYRDILDNASEGLVDSDKPGSRIRLRMGVYEKVDKSLDIERRFDRAKNAADSVRGSFSHAIGFYDETLHKKELFDEQLLEDFHSAIDERQFEVWHQPKFDIRKKNPILSSAEALVRWRHPQLGMVSPGVFIPLFEANGLIGTLDRYVWQETAAQIRRWKDALGFCVPVSVNVSRVDMLDPTLLDVIAALLADYGITPQDMLLEITESAYTQDSDQIIQTVIRLREMGFQVEMDDFGTGYSSLNMISTLPIDALKLDMQFIRTAFDKRHDTRMLEVIIEIADYLSVPVIAEGVETAEQLNALKAMGCDIVQGYYFSKPIPAAEYERFLVERRDLQLPAPEADSEKREMPGTDADAGFGKVAYALSSGYSSIYYVDLDNDHYVEFSSQGRYEQLQIEHSGTDFFADTLRNIPRVVFEEDQARLSRAMEKENLVAHLAANQSFSILYRLVIDGSPRYFSTRVVMTGTYDRSHIVIGVRDMDDDIRAARRIGEQSGPLVRPDPASFPRISQALAQDYFIIYYVDVETDHFVEYSAGGDFTRIGIEKQGEDFFDLSRRNMPRFVYPDDIPGFQDVFTKENILREIDENGSLSVTYRMMLDGEPKYVLMKAARLDECHIVIGTSNVNTEVRRQKAAAVRSAVAQALSADYFLIFYVDIASGRFIQYRPTETDGELDVEKGGEDFFSFSREQFYPKVSKEYREQMAAVLDKDRLLRVLSESGSYTLDFSCLINDKPTYMHLKASRMEDGDDGHIVIGLRNIDERIRREQAQARALQKANELASCDGLTGVKSKRVFVEAELMWDAHIEEGSAVPFAVAVFDLNGLKHINDSQGHAAGDCYICAASSLICKTFQHSPVYRIGGDEFAAILTGDDYEQRQALKDGFRAANAARSFPEEAVVACGMSAFARGKDLFFRNVFERADADMYENKRELKEKQNA